jgi:predicted esterase
MGREYFLYLPDKMDPKKTYWLVVGVHGFQGNGKDAAGLADWVKKGDCIVVGPSFLQGFQVLAFDTDKQLLGLFTELRKKYRLHDKMFLYGFSAGSQFAHRFAMAHPEVVTGCAAHSGGSWATTNTLARRVAFAISCGEADPRIELAKKYVEQLDKGRFLFKAQFWPGVGHSRSKGSQELTEECYQLVTTGLYPEQRKLVDAEIPDIRKLIAGEEYLNAAGHIKKLIAGEMPKKPEQAETKDKGAKTRAEPDADKSGWHENAEARAELRTKATAYLKEQGQALVGEFEKAAEEKVAAIEDAKADDAAAQLEKLKEQFKDSRRATRTVEAALARIKKPAPAPKQ